MAPRTGRGTIKSGGGPRPWTGGLSNDDRDPEDHMTDAARGNRPLSPHLTVYRLQVTSGLSILHRVTGCGLLVAAILVVWWFLAMASGPEPFERADGLITSWVGGFVLFMASIGLWYHFANGIRHLAWDAGYGFDLPTAQKSAVAVAAATAVMTVVTLIIAFV